MSLILLYSLWVPMKRIDLGAKIQKKCITTKEKEEKFTNL